MAEENKRTGRPKGAVNLRTKMLSQLEGLFSGETEDQKDAFIRSYLEEFKSSALAGGWAAKPLWDALAGKDPIEAIDKLLSKAKREDEDFNSYRVLKECHDIQQEILLTKSRSLATMAGRRAGKTQGNSYKIIHGLMTGHSRRYLIIHLTVGKSIEQYFPQMIDRLEFFGIHITDRSLTEGRIRVQNGGEIYFRGNNTKDEREKFRGDQWDGIVIDECQSQKALDYLIEEVLYPTLIDRRGWLLLSGTGPRIRGTSWERRFFDLQQGVAGGRAWNWNITHNPFVPDHEKVLKEVLEKNSWTDTNPIFVREWLGKISYDDDALLLRLSPDNFYEEADLVRWVNTQPVTDIHFTAGLDFGFTDADAFVIVAYSDSRPEKYVVWQYKKNRIGTDELAHAIQDGIHHVQNHPAFQRVEDKYIQIYADSSHGITSYDLSVKYNLPVTDAYKQNKDLAYENLQSDVRKGNVKLRHGIFDEEGLCVANHLEDEANKTVFKRNGEESANPYQLTREIDDEAYHPDSIDALLYAMRKIWIYSTYDEDGNVQESTEKQWFDKQVLPESMRPQ